MATACVEKPRKGYVIYCRPEAEDFLLGAAGTDAGYMSRRAEEPAASPVQAGQAPARDVLGAENHGKTEEGELHRGGSWAAWLGFAKRRQAERPCRFVHVRVETGFGFETAALGESAEMAERVRGILERYAPVVRTHGPDEFVLDFAGLKGVGFDLRATIARIPGEIASRTGLAARVGAGASQAMAAMASRKARSGGVIVVAPGSEELFLRGLAVAELIGIPAGVLATLADCGIATVGRLRGVPKAALMARFGPALGVEIWKAARGVDGCEISACEKKIARHVGCSGEANVEDLLGYLAKRVGLALEDAGEYAAEVGLLVRYADERCVRRSAALKGMTQDEVELKRVARELFAAMGTRELAACGLELSVEVGSENRRLVPQPETHRAAERGRRHLTAATA